MEQTKAVTPTYQRIVALFIYLLASLFVSAKVHAIGSAPDGEKQSEHDINRAFMNCLLGVDQMVEDFGSSAHKFSSEVETETKRCNRLRDSCKANPASMECEVFVEEFTSEESS
jgi:hypothetical protein